LVYAFTMFVAGRVLAVSHAVPRCTPPGCLLITSADNGMVHM
jgi:hypothetical protein